MTTGTPTPEPAVYALRERHLWLIRSFDGFLRWARATDNPTTVLVAPGTVRFDRAELARRQADRLDPRRTRQLEVWVRDGSGWRRADDDDQRRGRNR